MGTFFGNALRGVGGALGGYANTMGSVYKAVVPTALSFIPGVGGIASNIAGAALGSGQQSQPVPANISDPNVFDEAQYLANYPDIAAAVRAGTVSSGLDHYNISGKAEGRNWNRPAGATPVNTGSEAVRQMATQQGTSQNQLLNDLKSVLQGAKNGAINAAIDQTSVGKDAKADAISAQLMKYMPMIILAVIAVIATIFFTKKNKTRRR